MSNSVPMWEIGVVALLFSLVTILYVGPYRESERERRTRLRALAVTVVLYLAFAVYLYTK